MKMSKSVVLCSLMRDFMALGRLAGERNLASDMLYEISALIALRLIFLLFLVFYLQ